MVKTLKLFSQLFPSLICQRTFWFLLLSRNSVLRRWIRIYTSHQKVSSARVIFFNFFLIFFCIFFHCSELLRKACSRRKQTLQPRCLGASFGRSVFFVGLDFSYRHQMLQGRVFYSAGFSEHWRISPHKNQNNFCDFIISPHEKCKNLRGGADSGRGLSLDVFADLHKRIRGFSPAKTAGFLHKNGKRACLRPEAAGAPQIYVRSVEIKKVEKIAVHFPRIKCFRWKTWQAAGEPRRFALYFFADLAFSYRLNAACPVFLLRTLSGACNENRSIKCCRTVFSTPQAFLSTGGFLHIKTKTIFVIL